MTLGSGDEPPVPSDDMANRIAGDSEIAARLASFVADPGHSFIGTDFDGTLAPIVPRPVDARAVPGAVEALNEAGRRFGLVAVVTGRPASTLPDLLPVNAEVLLCASYGRQFIRGDRRSTHPATQRYLPLLRDAEKEAGGIWSSFLPKGTKIEHKDLSFVVHYRGVPHDGERIEYIDESVVSFAEGAGLVAHLGKKSIEVTAPDGVDKGSTVTDLVVKNELRRGVFFGDDLGDLAAFEALGALQEESDFEAVRVAVLSPEMPAELAAQADLVVESPARVLAAIEHLAGIRELGASRDVPAR